MKKLIFLLALLFITPLCFAAEDAKRVTFTPAGTIAATNVQAAIEEVASEAGGGGSGDITAVGDCLTGDCFTGTSGNTLTFKGATSGTIAFKPAAVAGTNTITLPAETGTVATTGSVASGYQGVLTNSAGLLGALSDETGTGLAVFSTSPIFTTDITTPKVKNSGNITIDAINAAAASTVAIQNSDATYTANLTVDGNVTATGTVGGSNLSGTNTGDNTVATTGDSATAFFSTGTLEDALLPTTITRDTEWDTEAEVQTAWGAVNIILATEIDTFAELDAIVADKALVNKADGAVWLGAHDFGGATSVEIPNAVNPTVSVAGQISVDTSATTGSALRFYGDAQYTLPAWQKISFTIDTPIATSDYSLTSFPANITIRQIRVLCTGGTNLIGGLDEADANGATPVAVDADITATAGTTATDDGTLTNPTIDANDILQWHTTSISGTPTSLTVTIFFTYDAVA